jgi:hypothetical protein
MPEMEFENLETVDQFKEGDLILIARNGAVYGLSLDALQKAIRGVAAGVIDDSLRGKMVP